MPSALETKKEGTGERIGAYRVVRRIATGGTSDVLLAKAEGPHGFERTVVLKLLLSQYRADEEFARMFAREASAYARLSNPAIVQLHDFFSAKAAPRGPGPQEEQLVMVLEYVDGPTLHRLRGMLKTVGQVLDDSASFYVAMRIYEALAAAHGAVDDSGAPAPVIHRDVNPANVLVSWDGDVKLADFGVAKVTGVTHQSAAGLIKGTYGYMAPEQVTGEAVTPKADVYGAAIILWELLTRRRAFQRGALPEVEVLRMMAEPRIPALDLVRPDVDKSIRDALKTALDPVPAKRNITAAEMVSILRAAVTPESGRQRLQASLALVRHEPKTSGEIAAVAPGTPTAPRVAPRPNLSKPAAPRAAPPLPTKASRKTMAYGASPSPPAEPVRPSDRVRLATPLESAVPAMNVGEAIDEILRGVPLAEPPKNVAEEIAARRRADADRETLTADAIGDIPKAPPPLAATLPIAGERDGSDVPTVVPPPPPPFPALDKTLTLDTKPRSPAPPEAASIGDAPTQRPPPYVPPAAMPTPFPPPERQQQITEAPTTRPKKSSGLVLMLLLLVVAIGIGLAGTVGYAHWKRAHPPASSVGLVAADTASAVVPAASASAPASAAPVESASAEPPASASASAEPVASASASASAAPPGETETDPTMGTLDTTGAPSGRRIFVDEKVVGETPESPQVKCGKHQVRIGSAGKTQTVDVPCGGSISVN